MTDSVSAPAAPDARAMVHNLAGDTWVDQTGRAWQVHEMSCSHRANLRRWLRRRASLLWNTAAWEYVEGPRPTADQAGYAFDDEFAAINDTHPIGWLKEQPFYRALVEMVWLDSRAHPPKGVR